MKEIEKMKSEGKDNGTLKKRSAGFLDLFVFWY